MVYEIIWTQKAVQSYARNMQYLHEEWPLNVTLKFIGLLKSKLELLTRHPYIGSARNKKDNNLRFTVLHKRVVLVYRVKVRKKQIELLLFWNTYHNPGKLQISASM